MERKHFYTVVWTQAYSLNFNLEDDDGFDPSEYEGLTLMEKLVEIELECGGFTEADCEIDRIMKL